MNLDLSKFEKVESGPKHTILRHPSGKTIKVAHGGLSNDLRAQIEAMPHLNAYAKGGEVNPNMVDPNNALNQFVHDHGQEIVGGTIKDGSEDEKFIFHQFCFDIAEARHMSKKKANAEVPVSSKWLDKIKVDPEAAMESESKNPVFIAQVHTPAGLKPLLIDGNHRMYKAVQKGKKTIEAHVFSPEQTKQLMIKKPLNAERELAKRDEEPQKFAKGGEVYTKRPGKGVGPEASGVSKMSRPAGASPDPQYTEPKDIGTKQLKPQGISRGAYLPCMNPSCKSYGKSHPNCRCYSGSEYVQGMAEGGETKKERFCDANRTHFKGCEYYADGTPDAPVGNDQSSDENDQTNDLPQLQTPSLLQDQSSNVAAPNPQTEIPETDVPQQEPADVNQNPQPADPYAHYQQKLFDINQFMHDQSQKFYSDVDQGHIQPKTFNQLFHDKDLPGKIGTLFGLIVSGAGAGITHQDNAVLTMMQKQIDNDLQAQERNQANRQNLMSINGQNLSRMADAGKIGMDIRQMQIEQSKDQANYYLYNQLAKQAMNYSNPQQAAKAANILKIMYDGMQQDKASAFARAAGANALGQMVNQRGGDTTALKTGLYGPKLQEYGQDIENKKVPGYGVAQLPVPKDARDTLTNLDRFDTSLNHLKNLISTHAGTLDWSKYPEADTAAREAQQAYSAVRGSIPSYAGDEQLNKIITGGKNPLNIISYLKGNPGRIDEIQKANDIQRKSVTEEYKIPNKPAPQPQSGPQIKIVNGIKYKRGPHGEAIRVD